MGSEADEYMSMRVRELMVGRGMKVADLAAVLGTGTGSIRNALNVSPTSRQWFAHEAVTLAAHFGVDAGYFFAELVPADGPLRARWAATERGDGEWVVEADPAGDGGTPEAVGWFASRDVARHVARAHNEALLRMRPPAVAEEPGAAPPTVGPVTALP